MSHWFSVIVWGCVIVGAFGLVQLFERIARALDRRDGPHFVQQLEAWQAKNDPPIAPLPLPPVRPLTAQRQAEGESQDRRGGQPSVRFPHVVTRPNPSSAQLPQAPRQSLAMNA